MEGPGPLRLLAVAAGLTLLNCALESRPLAPSAAPAEAPVLAECHPTLAFMSPPEDALEFVASSSSDPNARELLKTANWYGNEALWVLLPRAGQTVGLEYKRWAYRLKPGLVEYEARRLDGTGAVARRPIGSEGYYGRFQAGVLEFPAPGCWEVTFTLDGQYPLRFVVRAK